MQMLWVANSLWAQSNDQNTITIISMLTSSLIYLGSQSQRDMLMLCLNKIFPPSNQDVKRMVGYLGSFQAFCHFTKDLL